MPSITVTRKQKVILNIIEKENQVSRSFISSRTSLNLEELNRVLQNIIRKGLITQYRLEGEPFYSSTSSEYTLSTESEDEETILQFLKKIWWRDP